jgi:hypothetical protein
VSRVAGAGRAGAVDDRRAGKPQVQLADAWWLARQGGWGEAALLGESDDRCVIFGYSRCPGLGIGGYRDYGDNGFIEEYTGQIRGEPTSAVATITRNPAGKAQRIVVNHRPRSSVLLFARLMGEKYAGTPLAEYFITSES